MFSHALMETLLISSISSSEHLKEQCHGFLEQNNYELGGIYWKILSTMIKEQDQDIFFKSIYNEKASLPKEMNLQYCEMAFHWSVLASMWFVKSH